MERISYFNVGRILTDEEWKELEAWKKDPLNYKLKLRKWTPHSTDDSLVFYAYRRRKPNGEHWILKDSTTVNNGFSTKPPKRIPVPTIPSPEGKISFLKDIKRRLTDEEFSLLVEWKTNNPNLAWKMSDPHPEIEGVVFNTYRKGSQAGEYWVTKNQFKAIRVRDKRSKDRAKLKERSEEQIKRTRRVKADGENRRRENPLYKMKVSLRTSVRRGFLKKSLSKNKRTEEILGISFVDFRTYIQSLFEPWMNWENYGGVPSEPNTKWEFDHIIPLTTAKTEEDLIRLNHYTNIQPLCSYVNRFIKKDSLEFNKSF